MRKSQLSLRLFFIVVALGFFSQEAPAALAEPPSRALHLAKRLLRLMEEKEPPALAYQMSSRVVKRSRTLQTKKIAKAQGRQ